MIDRKISDAWVAAIAKAWAEVRDQVPPVESFFFIEWGRDITDFN